VSLWVGVYPKEGLFFEIEDECVWDEDAGGVSALGEFLPEVGAGLDAVVLVLVGGEDGVGLLV
jgi:hypothetical protein